MDVKKTLGQAVHAIAYFLLDRFPPLIVEEYARDSFNMCTLDEWRDCAADYGLFRASSRD